MGLKREEIVSCVRTVGKKTTSVIFPFICIYIQQIDRSMEIQFKYTNFNLSLNQIVFIHKFFASLTDKELVVVFVAIIYLFYFLIIVGAFQSVQSCGIENEKYGSFAVVFAQLDLHNNSHAQPRRQLKQTETTQ